MSVGTMMRPEHRLLLACARVCPGSDRDGFAASSLDGVTDWEYLLQAAGAHRISARLYRHLQGSCRGSIPSEVFSRLHRHYLGSCRSNLVLSAELVRVLELFDRNHIPAIPFKGPALGQALYGDPTLREFGDLDILVQAQDVFKGLKLLESLRYDPIPEYRPGVQSRILEWKNHYLVGKRDAATVVELHWCIVPAYFMLPVSIEGWWKRAQRCSFEGRETLALSAEDLLIALCIHGCKHLWRSLDLFADVAGLLERHSGLDWDFILSGYSHPGVRRVLFTGLLAAAGLVDARVPVQVLQTARSDPAAVQLSRQAQDNIFRERRGREALRFVAFQLRSRTCWMDRVRFSHRILVSPVICGRGVVLPRLLVPFYKAWRRCIP